MSTVIDQLTDKTMPITCTICQQECKNERGLNIHISKKHRQGGNPDLRGTNEKGATGHCFGITDERKTNSKKDIEDKDRQRPWTTERREKSKDKIYQLPKPNCTEEEYRKLSTVKNEHDARCTNKGDVDGKFKPTGTQLKTIPPKLTSERFTTRDKTNIRQVEKPVLNDQHVKHFTTLSTTTQTESPQHPEQLLKETEDRRPITLPSSMERISNAPLQLPKSGSDYEKSKPDKKLPIMCTICQQECKNEHGLRIHISKKHRQGGSPNLQGKNEECDTEHSGTTGKYVTKTKENNDDKNRRTTSTTGDNDDKNRRRPSTTGRKDESKDESDRKPKSSCTEEEYRNPPTVKHDEHEEYRKYPTVKHEHDACCSNNGDADAGSPKTKHTRTEARLKTSPSGPTKVRTLEKDTNRHEVNINENLVLKDLHSIRKTESLQFPEQQLRKKEILSGKQTKPEKLSESDGLTTSLPFLCLPCPVTDVTKYIAMLEGGIVRPRKDSELPIKGVNEFMDRLLTATERNSNVPLQLLRSGSHYERSKIEYDDEFDFMVCPKAKFEAVFTDCPDGFCKLRKGRTTIKDLDQTLNKDGYFVPELFKQKMFSIFDDCIKSSGFRQGRRTKRKPRQPESPAFTLQFDLGVGKPAIDIDLVPAIRIDSWPLTARKIHPEWIGTESVQRAMKCFHVVTKTYPGDHPDADLLWRISFSHAEKELILHANQKDKGCRKEIFKILKKIKEIIKFQNPNQTDKFCSYHLKMFMLEFYDRHKDFSQENKETLFKESIKELMKCFSDGEIKNYFIQKDNILRFVSDDEKLFVAQELRKLQEKF